MTVAFPRRECKYDFHCLVFGLLKLYFDETKMYYKNTYVHYSVGTIVGNKGSLRKRFPFCMKMFIELFT